ncbi:MAG TPA: dTDP-4-dehydrorhamnose 3,5-epimerase [Thermodesulfobacterium commune]|nr:MAG: dTDP-4-dehydrorhamnose 3,5-epimerase [Thermodesulfobacterium commune]HCP09437.1 dTDP-4-dehydrorhamnose 3,5-epimerase [Thermodesulfobacterium commune]
MSIIFKKLDLPDVLLIVPKIFKDHRGYFMETYKKSDFEKEGLYVDFIQDNHSYSVKGVLRGFHYQKKPKAQGKLVRCVVGKIFDVAVDIRKNSPTFGKWVGVELSEENGYMLWIPEGFAHGFLVLSDYAHVIYKVSGAEYSPEHDAGIIWNDEDIGVKWPLNKVEKVLLSEKDRNLPRLKDLQKDDLL